MAVAGMTQSTIIRIAPLLETFLLSHFYPMQWGAQGTQFKPDLVGKEMGGGASRDTVSLISRARNNLGMDPPTPTTSGATSSFVLGSAATSDANAANASTVSPSATPMRDRMSNVMSSMGVYAKGRNSSSSSSTPAASFSPAAAIATAAEPANAKKSMFGSFFESK